MTSKDGVSKERIYYEKPFSKCRRWQNICFKRDSEVEAGFDVRISPSLATAEFKQKLGEPTKCVF